MYISTSAGTLLGYVCVSDALGRNLMSTKLRNSVVLVMGVGNLPLYSVALRNNLLRVVMSQSYPNCGLSTESGGFVYLTSDLRTLVLELAGRLSVDVV